MATPLPNADKRHLLLLPMPAFGHILPLLELGRQLSKHHKVTLAVSSLRLEQLQQRGFTTSADEANPNLHLFPIQDGAQDFDIEDPNVAEKMAQTFQRVFSGIGELMQTMPVKQQTGSSVPNFEAGPVDFVIADGFVAGPAAACVSRGVGFFQFHSTSTTMTLPALLQITEDTPVISAPGEMAPGLFNAGQPMFQQTPQGFRMNLPPEMKQLLMGMKSTLPLCQGIILNDVRELEDPKIIETFAASNKQLSIRIVGPLLGPVEPDSQKDQNFIDFLNRHQPRSVVYVSFGSMFVLSAEQIAEIGEALLEIGKAVIWSLPQRQRLHLPGKLQQNGEKLLIESWVPQRLVLEHESTGLFITHTGWNSVLEALFGGVPMVCWPMGAEQHLNGQRVELMKVGKVIEKTSMKGRLVGRNEIVEMINRCAGWNGAGVELQKMAQKTRQMVREAVENGGSAKDMHQLVTTDMLTN